MRKRMQYFLAGLVLLVPVIGLAILSATATRPRNLGVVDSRLAPCPKTPNCVSTQATEDSQRMDPLPFEGGMDESTRRLQAALATMPRLKIVTATKDYIHDEATSRIFRFVDDVEFFLDREAQVIHFRSASRVGRSDLGANRARMEQIRAAFQQPSGEDARTK
jgi:uncharacterized protein (DUF1499 family)